MTSSIKQILLIGNPNVGKSAIFHHLTGKYVTVSNYPGTTVTITSGKANFDDGITVVDAPGINSLIPLSEDEKVARDLLLGEGERLVLQVADSKNLERALLLTIQLAEAGLPFLLVLNMADEAEERGMKIDQEKLSQILGIPVVSSVATKGQGISQIKENIGKGRCSTWTVKYSDNIERDISRIESLLPSLPLAKRAIAIMLLSGDSELKNRLVQRMKPEEFNALLQLIAEIQSRYIKSITYLLNQRRMQEIKKIVKQVLVSGAGKGRLVSELIGKWSIHPIAGIPILLFVLYLLYLIVGQVGAGRVVDFIEEVVFGQFINPAITRLFTLFPIPLVQELFVGEFGLITMGLTFAIAIILPVIGFFFLCFGLLEDSGYLPRLAILVNNLFKHIGLSGKAVVPLIVGLGCVTMATLVTRTLETKRERLIATLLLALAIPCSAQMAVILALLAGVSGQATLFYFSIILLNLLLVGYLAAKILPGRLSDFVLEIPPIRMPLFSNVATRTLARIGWYLKEVVPLFLLGTFILFILNKLGVLMAVERAASPVVEQWLGLPLATTTAFIMGFLRRDYGAVGFYKLSEQGLLSVNQILISLVVLTLFVPCIANFFVIIKERGLKTALAIVSFVFPFAILVGGVLNFTLKTLGIVLQ